MVTYENHTEVIWFTRYKNWLEDGSDWFLEAPCYLDKFEFKDDSDEAIREYVTELYDEEDVQEEIKYVRSMIRNGWLYEIDSPQTSPFLPNELDDLTLVSEQYCLEWMLKNKSL